MGRNRKYPDADKTIRSFFTAVSESYNSPGSGETGSVDGKKKFELLSEEFGISRLKVRKILITTGDLQYPETNQITALAQTGMSNSYIAEKLGMSYQTVNSFIPYTKGVYKLSEVSAAAERTERYRLRMNAVKELQDAIANDEDWPLSLWKAIVLFAGYPFMTSGRGKERRGAMKFTYIVSDSGRVGGKHYIGESVDGFGNEMWIEGKKKSISRSTVERAMKTVLELDGKVRGPKALNVPGAHSYLFPILLRFGVIDPSQE